MKVYEFGSADKPSIMLFPGTCCYWKTNFGHVLDNLQKHFYTLIVSYSGFDETEDTTFISELDEVQKVETYIKDRLHGNLFAAYGFKMGGKARNSNYDAHILSAHYRKGRHSFKKSV